MLSGGTPPLALLPLALLIPDAGASIAAPCGTPTPLPAALLAAPAADPAPAPAPVPPALAGRGAVLGAEAAPPAGALPAPAAPDPCPCPCPLLLGASRGGSLLQLAIRRKSATNTERICGHGGEWELGDKTDVNAIKYILYGPRTPGGTSTIAPVPQGSAACKRRSPQARTPVFLALCAPHLLLLREGPAHGPLLHEGPRAVVLRGQEGGAARRVQRAAARAAAAQVAPPGEGLPGNESVRRPGGTWKRNIEQ